MSIVVAFGDDTAAYPAADLGVVANDTIGGVPIAVVVEPLSLESWAVFSRTLDDETVVQLAFTDSGELIDTMTGTTFHPSRGTGIEGPLSDQVWDQLPSFTSFTEDYFTFYPDGRVWTR